MFLVYMFLYAKKQLLNYSSRTTIGIQAICFLKVLKKSSLNSLYLSQFFLYNEATEKKLCKVKLSNLFSCYFKAWWF